MVAILFLYGSLESGSSQLESNLEELFRGYSSKSALFLSLRSRKVNRKVELPVEESSDRLHEHHRRRG